MVVFRWLWLSLSLSSLLWMMVHGGDNDGNDNDNDTDNDDNVSSWLWNMVVPMIVTILVGWMSVLSMIKYWGKRTYAQLMHDPVTCCDIDAFVNNSVQSNAPNEVKVSLFHKLRLGNRIPSEDPIPLELVPSDHIPGLLVSQRLGTQEKKQPTQTQTQTQTETQKIATAAIPLEEFLKEQHPNNKNKQNDKCPIVVATIRMGFGHHRLAYSTVSWALSNDHPTIFHDLLNIDSEEAQLLVSTDDLYSKFSRWSSEMGGWIEKLWGKMLLTGDPDALRAAYLTAVHLRPLLLQYPKHTPIISTHQLVTLTASACGFTNVTNLVVDNFAQWFLVVPNCLNIVQGPVNYQNFLTMMGTDTILLQPPQPQHAGTAGTTGTAGTAKLLDYAGHWNPKQLVDHIVDDCTRRIQRANKRASSKHPTSYPLRLLIPVGGAGAQRKFILQMIQVLTPHLQKGTIQIFLNAGDHSHMKHAFQQVLEQNQLSYDTITTLSGVHTLQQRLLQEDKEDDHATKQDHPPPISNVTLFAFDDYFPAVATTDIMCRAVDILCCKPSELAFYALPKLHIRRVGDHEAYSAIRASELGDGSVEAREINDVQIFLQLFLQSPPHLFIGMNQAVMANHTLNIYSGCQKAVQWTVQKAQQP